MSFTIKAGLFALVLSSLALGGCTAPVEVETEEDSAEVTTSRSAHFETFVGMDGQYYFDLVAGNGQNVLRSEGYTTASGAQSGIRSVVANGVDPSSFEIEQAVNGEYYFNIVSGNHEIVATSELYTTKYSAQRGATTVRTLASMTGATPATQPAVKRERFEVFTGEDKKFYFRLRAGNGEIVLASQGYTTKASALNGALSVKTNGVTTSHYKVIETINGEYSIRLVASNGQIIGRGETYVSSSNATRGVDTIVKILADGVAETAQ